MAWDQAVFKQSTVTEAVGVWAVQSAAQWGGAALRWCPILTFRTSLLFPLGALSIFALAPSSCCCSYHVKLCLGSWFLCVAAAHTFPLALCQGSCPGARSGLCRARSWWQRPAQRWPCSELSSQRGCRSPTMGGDMGPAQLKQQLWAGWEQKKPSPAFSWILSFSLAQNCNHPFLQTNVCCISSAICTAVFCSKMSE